MPPRDLTARYIRLVNELGGDLAHARGWRRRVAERLGIDESTLSRILKGHREVGWDLAERAIDRLKLDPGYFTAARKKGGAEQPSKRGRADAATVRELVSKLESGAGTASDVYALARAVVDSPAVQRAQSILKIPAPKSEQQTGALFMAASRLIEDLRELD